MSFISLTPNGLVLMGRSGTVGGFLAGCFINQLGAGLLLPTLLVWSMSVLPFAVRGRGTGFWQSAFALGQWLSPLVVTFFAQQRGGLMKSFETLGFLAAAGLAVTLLTRLVPGPGRAGAAHG